MPSIKAALDLTTSTIDCRARRYRNAIVVVVITSLVSIIWAIVTFSWKPLCGLLLLVPIVGWFLYLDGKHLHQWQQGVLYQWYNDDVSPYVLALGLKSIPTLPEITLESMLALLPTDDKLSTSSRGMRRAVSKTLSFIYRYQERHTVTRLLVLTSCLLTAVASYFMSSLWILLGVLAVVPIMLLRLVFTEVAFRHWRSQIQALQKEHNLNISLFIEAARDLNWNSVPEEKISNWLAALE